MGGGDADGNPRLRTALLACRAANMPNNVDRAVEKGTGEIPGVTYEEIRYEGYAPGGVAVIIDVLTDNSRRTVGEIRHILTKHGGSLAEKGAVTWNFESKGLITIEKEGLSPDDLVEKAIEAGADDVDTEGDMYEITTEPSDLHAVVGVLEGLKVQVKEAKLTMLPKTQVSAETKTVGSVLRLMEKLSRTTKTCRKCIPTSRLPMTSAVMAE